MSIWANIWSETIQRLETLGIPINKGDGSIEVNKFPSIYISMDEETGDLLKPGLYERRTRVWIEYFLRYKSNESIVILIDNVKTSVSETIEIDDNFNNLVIFYGLTALDWIQYPDRKLQVVLGYEFVYKESSPIYSRKNYQNRR